MNAELLDRLTRVFISAWSNKSRQLPDPLRIKRPGEKPETLTPAQMAQRMLGR